MADNGAKLLLQVDDLQASIVFYTQQLGWELLERAASGPVALLRITSDYDAVLIQQTLSAQLLTEAQTELAAGWLQNKYASPKKGDLIYVGVASVNAVEASLQAKGCKELRKEENPGHIRKLFVPDVDGYTFVYWEELPATHAEIVEMYAAGADELESAIAGLTEEQLNRSQAPGKWSIRQQVLHLIDLELVTLHKVKFALAEPGRAYQGNSFSQDDWSIGLDYRNRSIHAEVQLFRAMRQHILGLCEHLPNALERTVTTKERKESVALLLKMMAGHAKHHIRAVNEIRDLHDC
ncbi:DinB family protein [Paenibacillus anseongense]|uniref:DinB family protein n=1 Tax=Paenibacillus TaxID=44249 RepID=UPI002DB5EC21|nr:DinB family protein [Paenibacillus anseongense]MEC0270382.1 DinB family protein [Paenibacillus anseongense]